MKVGSIIRNRYIFLYILLMAQCVVYGMEQQEVQKPMQTIAIRGTDGRIFGVTQDVAMQASTIRNYFDDAHEDAAPAGEKECSFDVRTVDFTQHVFNRVFSTREEVEALDLNTATLKILFDCIADEKNIEQLDKEDVMYVFEVAHCLGVSENIMQQLSQRASSLISKKEFRDNSENPLYAMLDEGHYFTTIKQLFKSNRLASSIHCAKIINSLPLQSRQIDTLAGIEEVALACPSVTRLNLSDNNLKTLNIRLLFACWPGLQKIKANNNGTTKVIWPSSLPHFVSVRLNHNCLDEETFFIPEQAVVSLKHNKLKINPDVIIKKPTIFQKHRPVFKTLVDPYVMLRTGAGFVIYSGIFVGLPLGAFKIFRSEPLLPMLYDHCRNPLFVAVLFSWPLTTTVAFYIGHVFPQALNHNMQYQFRSGQAVVDQDEDGEKEATN